MHSWYHMKLDLANTFTLVLKVGNDRHDRCGYQKFKVLMAMIPRGGTIANEFVLTL